jgi:hypothetical protein
MARYHISHYLFILLLFFLFLFLPQNSYSKDKQIKPYCKISSYESAYILQQIELGNKLPIKAIEECKRNDRSFIAKVIKVNPKYFQFASESIKDDEVFISKFVSTNLQILKYISSRLSKDHFFMLWMIKLSPEAIQYTSSILTDNKSFMTKVVDIDPKNFIYASDRLQNDKEFVLWVVKKNGKMLKFASDKLQDDTEVAVEAIKSYNLAISFVSQKLQKDTKIKQLAAKIDQDFLINLDQFLRENYGGIGVGPGGYRGYHIVNMAKNFPEKRIFYQPYLTKWQRVYKNGVETNELKLFSKDNSKSDWKNVFSEYSGLNNAIKKVLSNNGVDNNTIDALNLVSFWIISKEPNVIALNLYLLRETSNLYLDGNGSNVTSLIAIANEKTNKEWSIDIVDAVFDADLTMSVSYKSGHKKYQIWDVYKANKDDKDPKILFKVEDNNGEYFDLFAKQINNSYASIYKYGGYAMGINIFED